MSRSTPVELKVYIERDRRAAVVENRATGRLSDREIQNEIRGAIRSLRALRGASQHERDALEAMIWAKVLDAENPVILTRDDRGHHWLRQTAQAIARDTRDWRDTCDNYVVRAQAADDSVRTVVAAFDWTDDAARTAAENRNARVMAEQAHELAHADLSPVSADIPAIAEDALAVLADTDFTPAETRRVIAALARVGAVAAGADPQDALGALARAQGRSVNAVTTDASRGADLLRGHFSRDELAAAWTTAVGQWAKLDDDDRDRDDVVNAARIAEGCARTRASAGDIVNAAAAVNALTNAGGSVHLATGAPGSWRALRTLTGSTVTAPIALRAVTPEQACRTDRAMPARPDARRDAGTCHTRGTRPGHGAPTIGHYIEKVLRAEDDRADAIERRNDRSRRAAKLKRDRAAAAAAA